MILDDLTYERFTGADGRRMWRFSDGTVLPVVAGGADDGGAGDGGDGGSGEGEGGSGDGGEGVQGGSGEGSGSGDGTPSPEDVAKWKALARKHESESKKARAELDKLKAASQTDAEKAISEAEKKGEQTATAKLAQRLAAAEAKAALTGIVPDPAAVVEDLNLAKYVTDDGEVDSDAIASLRKKYEGFAKGSKAGGGNPFRQGQQGTAPDKAQLTRADLAKMSPAEIVKARRDGRLDDLAKGAGQ